MRLSRRAAAKARPNEACLVTQQRLEHLKHWSAKAKVADLQSISTTDLYDEMADDLQRVALFSKSQCGLTALSEDEMYDDQWQAQKDLLQRQEDNFPMVAEYLQSKEGYKAKSLLWRVLPPVTPDLIKRVIKGCKWSPGSNLSTKGGMVTPEYKQFGKQTVTGPSMGYAFLDYFYNIYPSVRRRDVLEAPIRCFIENRRPSIEHDNERLRLHAWYSFLSTVTVVKHERFSTVPKTSVKRRPITIGASLNVRIQLGVHDVLAKILKKEFGIDIHDQSRNREMARWGSQKTDYYRLFGTIDLSAASDSVTTQLLRGLLPPDWFEFLDTIRHHSCECQKSKEVIYPLRFSGMGNGFTFALETLIFAVIVKGACQANDMPLRNTEFSVYGDDIIVPSMYCDLVAHTLENAGFLINHDKSFWQGDFRESCGHDFYRGRFIRPFHLTSGLETNADLYTAINEMAARVEQARELGGDLRRLRKLIRLFLSQARSYQIVPNTDSVPSYSGIYNGVTYGRRIRSLTTGTHSICVLAPRDYPVADWKRYALRLDSSPKVFSVNSERSMVTVEYTSEPKRSTTRRGALAWKTRKVLAHTGLHLSSPLDLL